MDNKCCGNCKHYSAECFLCYKHDLVQDYGCLCTSWESVEKDEDYVTECGECEKITYIDDVLVCESSFSESTELKDDEGNHPKNEMLEAIDRQCKDMSYILKSKNTDYGNSFERTLNKYGDVALMLRLEDKFNRLESLFENKDNLVEDESFDDTIRDLAGYCLLYLAIKGRQIIEG